MLVLNLPFKFLSILRHTRSTRDWSSDVCSSDLDCPISREARRADQGQGQQCPYRRPETRRDRLREPRSEERRVGKDGRCLVLLLAVLILILLMTPLLSCLEAVKQPPPLACKVL